MSTCLRDTLQQLVLGGGLALDSGAQVVLHQEVGVLLIRRLREHSLLPQVRGQVRVRLRDGVIRGFGWNYRTMVILSGFVSGRIKTVVEQST